MNLLKRFGTPVVVALGVVALSPSEAEAVPYTFTECITANWAGCNTVPTQMKVDVTDAGGGFVDFTFMNEVGVPSSITALYFDAEGFFSSIAVQSQSAGVMFTPGDPEPPDAPGKNNASPPFSVTLLPNGPGSADNVTLAVDASGSPEGIDSATERLVVRLGLATGKTFSDIIGALDQGSNVDSLRIAAHVQSLPTGQSETIICCDTGTGIPSPEPASIALFGLMALALAHRMRRRHSA